MQSVTGPSANPVQSELDQALWQAWLKIQDKALGHELELRRRLDRRATIYDHVPRPLCLAIKASDRRITDWTAHLSSRHADDKGNEAEHDVLLTARTIKDLCRPVELYWGQKFRSLAAELGAPRQTPRRLERRGILRCRRIALLGGQRGLPVPLVDSPVPATAPPDACEWEHYGYPTQLDPSACGYRPPDKLLAPYWQQLSDRLPDWFQQSLRRKPIFRVQRRRMRFMHWVWLCPECQREVHTIYLPLGAPDFATLHNIKLPYAGRYDTPEPHFCLACQRCHHLFGLARTPKSISKSWSLLIAHLSGGLLFGREVKRPASFSALRQNKPLARPRSSPRRNKLESYLAHTDLPIEEIARRMHWTCASVTRELRVICKKRHLPATRPALKQWWTTHRSLSPLAA